MEITGKIIETLPIREGSTERGDWMVASYVLETSGNYPRKMLFEVHGKDRIERFNTERLMSTKEDVLVAFDIDAREYNGRWYNTIKAYDVRPNLLKKNTEEMAQNAILPQQEGVDKLPY